MRIFRKIVNIDADYYIGKLTEILRHSSIDSLTVVHVEVSCYSGLSYIRVFQLRHYYAGRVGAKRRIETKCITTHLVSIRFATQPAFAN
jgi:hypothetical protein